MIFFFLLGFPIMKLSTFSLCSLGCLTNYSENFLT